MSRSFGRRALAGLIAAVSVLTLLTGCTKTVEGTAAKSGSGDVPRNEDSAKQYPNLLKECEDILAKTVGADPLDIQSTFVGAVCRWQAANPAGLIDITRFWFKMVLYVASAVIIVLGTLVIFTFDPCIDPESTLAVCN